MTASTLPAERQETEAPLRPPLQLGVPAYAYPGTRPALWDRLLDIAPHLRFVVVNVHNGPGAKTDPAYAAAIDRLRAAGVCLVGYVDTDYARVSPARVARAAGIWRRRYGVRGVFLDQVAGDLAHLEYFAACAVGVRAAGAPFVVANPGTDCHPGYADLANVIVSFEGRWSTYQQYSPPAWMLERPADRFCHLVHSTPTRRLPTVADLAAGRHAGTVFFTDGAGANPWQRVPDGLVAALAAPAPEVVAQAPSSSPATWAERGFAADGYTDGHWWAGAPAAASGTHARRHVRGGPPLWQRFTVFPRRPD